MELVVAPLTTDVRTAWRARSAAPFAPCLA